MMFLSQGGDIMSTPMQDPRRARSSLSIYLSEIGGYAARDDLVTANLAFVVRVARRYAGLGVALEDLISEGNLGLLEAARHFDAGRGTRFITYAVWWIRKAILEALSGQSTAVRLPHTQRHKIRSVIDAERQLSRDLGRDAGRDEVATHLNLTVARVDRILQGKMIELSLDEATGDRSDIPLRDRIADGRTPSPEVALIRAEARACVRAALRTLGERERRVLADRFGLRGGRVRSLREIGAALGLSREAIRLIEMRAKKQLRRIVGGRPGRQPAGQAFLTAPRPSRGPRAGAPDPTTHRDARR